MPDSEKRLRNYWVPDDFVQYWIVTEHPIVNASVGIILG